MVNRAFMVDPQSLLSRSNSAFPAWRVGEGHHGEVFGMDPLSLYLSLSPHSPLFVSFSPSFLLTTVCERKGVQGGVEWDNHIQTAPREAVTTKTLANHTEH